MGGNVYPLLAFISLCIARLLLAMLRIGFAMAALCGALFALLQMSDAGLAYLGRYSACFMGRQWNPF
jgi:hypothetical protein